MKIGRILFLMSALAFSQAGMANHQASDKNSAADKMWVLDVDKQLEYCHKQVGRALDELRQKDGSYDFSMEPRNILKGDRQKGWNCRKATPEEWCDGFWPGILWMDYQNTGDEAVRKAAEGYTESLKGIAYRPCYDHDIGFLMFCSYGKGYEVNHSQEYKDVILASADSLATLFNPVVGTILSWPREVKPRNWPHNTIMDNMMNLDMMFWAAKNGGNKLLYDLAVTHAKTTMKNHFRPDGSCYHVAVYDSKPVNDTGLGATRVQQVRSSKRAMMSVSYSYPFLLLIIVRIMAGSYLWKKCDLFYEIALNSVQFCFF